MVENNEGSGVTATPTPTPTPAPTPPYNLYFAIVALAVAVGAYLLTMWLFRDLIKEPQDTATLAGALGGLFTLIGTVAGAYFGIKSTQDTTDKANKKTSEEAERTREANQRAQEA